MTFRELRFPSPAAMLSAWHFAGADTDVSGPAGKPVMVMAHGFAGTKDSGLQPFAEKIAAAGLDVLVLSLIHI